MQMGFMHPQGQGGRQLQAHNFNACDKASGA